MIRCTLHVVKASGGRQSAGPENPPKAWTIGNPEV